MIRRTAVTSKERSLRACFGNRESKLFLRWLTTATTNAAAGIDAISKFVPAVRQEPPDATDMIAMAVAAR
jgi:hypothetical protein